MDPIEDVQTDEAMPEEIESDYRWHLQGDELGAEMTDIAKQFTQMLYTRGRLDSWFTRVDYYHGNFSGYGDMMGHGLQKFGSRGQFYRYDVNQFRSILKAISNLATVTPPSFDVKAVNSDAESLQLAALGSNILDYYMHAKSIKKYLNRAVEHCLILDAGYAVLEWDTGAGREYGGATVVDPTYQGDIKIRNPLGIDVIFDPTAEAWEDLDWIIVRRKMPRVGALTRFPDKADEIKALTNDDDLNLKQFRQRLQQTWNYDSFDMSDDVQILTLFHRKTEFMNEGLLVKCLRDGTVLLESPLPYDKIPVVRMVHDEQTGTAWGRSPAIDLIANQEALNILNSSVLTNQANFAMQYVAIEQGCDISNTNLDSGMVMLEYPHGSQPPHGVNLTSTPPEIFRNKESIVHDMQTLLGISDASRGKSQGADQSGSALAFEVAQSSANQGPFQSNFATFAGDVATLILKVLRDFADTPRTLAILGKHSSARTTFSGKDLVAFDRVIAESGNPLLHSFAGRVQAANMLAQNRLIDGNNYISVLTSGNLDPMTENPRETANFIRSENEWLMDGKALIAITFDDHNIHITEHMSILNNVDYRNPNGDPKNSAVLKAVTDHIAQHMQFIAQNAQPPAPNGAPQGPGAPGPGMPMGAPGMDGPVPHGGQPTTADMGVSPQNTPANGQIANAGSRMPHMPQPAQPSAD